MAGPSSTLRSHRLRAGLSQEELSERSGISVRSISEIERGRHDQPFAGTVRRLADGLGLSASERTEFIEAFVLRRSAEVVAGRTALSASPREVGLPAPLTKLIGREDDVAAILRILALDGSRLLVLTGPGGVGKTRLAVEVGWRAGEQFDKIAFVGLAGLGVGEDVIPMAGRILGAAGDQSWDAVEAVAMVLGDMRTLLILDNFEHVAQSAPAVGRLLARVPRLSVICTSRSVLRVYGERVYSVEPLSSSTSNSGGRIHDSSPLSDSARLFANHMGLLRPRFRVDDKNRGTIEDICRRLDGLPLAIEMAAARARAIPLGDLLEGLEHGRIALASEQDVESRHASLQATIEWSYALLARAEQALLRTLSVFRAGFTAEAVAAVMDCDIASVRERLVSLADRCLVQWTGEDVVRFEMLETISQFARHQLEAQLDAGRVLRRHAEHFSSWLVDLHRDDSNVTWDEYFHVLEVEQPNIEAAMDFCRDSGNLPMAFEILSLDLAYRWQKMPGAVWPSWAASMTSLPKPCRGQSGHESSCLRQRAASAPRLLSRGRVEPPCLSRAWRRWRGARIIGCECEC